VTEVQGSVQGLAHKELLATTFVILRAAFAFLR
jgi:hypothetical protein